MKKDLVNISIQVLNKLFSDYNNCMNSSTLKNLLLKINRAKLGPY